MSSTQSLSAIGASRRRPSALLLPLAPFVLVVFALVLLVTTTRTAVTRLASATRALARWSAGAISAALAARAAARIAGEITKAGAASAAGVTSVASTGRLAGFQIRPGRTVAAAAAVFGAVLLAASMAGGTYAFLNAQRTTPAITVASGTLAVTVQAAGTTSGTTTAIPTAAWSNMLPGDFAGQQVTVVNTGNVAINATARLTATSPWEIRLIVGTCPTTQITSAALTTAAVGYGSLAPGASAIVCVQATLPTTAVAGVESTSASFSIVLDSTQATS